MADFEDVILTFDEFGVYTSSKRVKKHSGQRPTLSYTLWFLNAKLMEQGEQAWLEELVLATEDGSLTEQESDNILKKYTEEHA